MGLVEGECSSSDLITCLLWHLMVKVAMGELRVSFGAYSFQLDSLMSWSEDATDFELSLLK